MPIPERLRARAVALVGLVCGLFVCIRFMRLHRLSAPREATPFAAFLASPVLPPSSYGWWGWWDQGKYLEDATAWAHGALDPSLHYYLPGYALLATVFVRLGPGDPFFLPDLACLLADLLLFACLSARLTTDRRLGFAIGALVFAASTALSPVALWSWVLPWSTTPSSTCLFASLLASLAFLDHPRPSTAFLVGLLSVCIAWFRPADCLCFGVVAAPILCSRLRRPYPRTRIAAAAISGAALPLLGLLVVHVIVNGRAPGDYLALSGRIGFEWRLLPLRWVLLVIDPQPFLPSGHGLATIFPWILPGIAGMAATLLTRHQVRYRAHLLVIGVALLDGAMFLVYRDLHPPALWRQSNYHYFSWLLPLFGLYAVLLLRLLAQARLRPALAGIAIVALLSSWRIEATDLAALPPAISTQGGIRLPHGLSPLSEGALIPALDPTDQAYFGPDRIVAGNRTFLNTESFKPYPIAGGLMLLPLRAMPATDSLFLPAPGVDLVPGETPKLFRQTLVFGLPCWLLPRRPACLDRHLLVPPLLPLDRPARFGAGGTGDRYLLNGWSGPGPGGHWSEGYEAAFSFSLPDLPAGARPVLQLEAYGFMAGDTPPVRVRFSIDHRPIASAAFAGDRTQTIPLPTGARDIVLRLAFPNPRRPSRWSASTDSRLLGLYIERMTLSSQAWAPPKPAKGQAPF